MAVLTEVFISVTNRTPIDIIGCLVNVLLAPIDRMDINQRYFILMT